MSAVDDAVPVSLVIATWQHPSSERRTAVELPCRRDDPELWFAEAPADLERAKALCRACPIRLTCLCHAIQHNEYTGVWGGHIIERGRITPYKRPRGRPRKPAHNSGATSHTAATPEPDPIPLDPRRCGRDGRGAAALRLSDAERALQLAQRGASRIPIDVAHRMLECAAVQYLAATPVGRRHRRASRRTESS